MINSINIPSLPLYPSCDLIPSSLDFLGCSVVQTESQLHVCANHWFVRQPQWVIVRTRQQIRLVHDDAACVLQLSCLTRIWQTQNSEWDYGNQLSVCLTVAIQWLVYSKYATRKPELPIALGGCGCGVGKEGAICWMTGCGISSATRDIVELLMLETGGRKSSYGIPRRRDLYFISLLIYSAGTMSCSTPIFIQIRLFNLCETVLPRMYHKIASYRRSRGSIAIGEVWRRPERIIKERRRNLVAVCSAELLPLPIINSVTCRKATYHDQ
jgi:hypothetical protein